MLVSDVYGVGQAQDVAKALQEKLDEAQMKDRIIVGSVCLIVGFVIGAWFF